MGNVSAGPGFVRGLVWFCWFTSRGIWSVGVVGWIVEAVDLWVSGLAHRVVDVFCESSSLVVISCAH